MSVSYSLCPQYNILVLLKLFFLDHNFVKFDQLCSDLFISCGMKEEDGSSKDAIKKCESAVESDVVFILSQAAHREGYKAEWHYDKICPLHDLCRHLLSLVYPWQFPVLRRPRRLYEGQGQHHKDQDGDELHEHQRRVHLQPAVVLASIVRVSKRNDGESDTHAHAPADKDVLLFGHHAVLLDNEGDEAVGVESFKKHEDKGRREEHMDQDGYDTTHLDHFGSRVEKETQMCADKSYLHVHLNDSGVVEDP